MAQRLARRGGGKSSITSANNNNNKSSLSLRGVGGNDDDEKYSGKQSSWSRSLAVLFGIALVAYSLSSSSTIGFSMETSSSSLSSSSSSTSNAIKNDDIPTLRRAAQQTYENCTISFQPPPPRTDENDWRKPIWLPALPASGSASPSRQGDVVKALIDTLTGLDKATKNYHMSMRNRLKRCHGLSETVACSQGHPYVPIGPEGQTANFQKAVIMAIRNPRDVFPGGHIEKAIAYHNAKGQPSEDNWRNVRDQYYEGAVTTWKEMIEWWTRSEKKDDDNNYYHVSLFVPFERLLHPTTGPKLVQQLADVIQNEAGFEVAPSSEIPCIWYNVIHKEWKRQDVLMEYIPGYRVVQRDYLAKEVKSFLEQVEAKEEEEEEENGTSKLHFNKQELVGILQEYYEDIQENTRIDEAAIVKNEEEEKKKEGR